MVEEGYFPGRTAPVLSGVLQRPANFGKDGCRLNPEWRREFENAATVEQWNASILPLMHSRGDDYKRQAHIVARGRNYEYRADLGRYAEGWRMHPVRRGVNLVSVGWRDGILRVGYQRKDRIEYYVYRSPCGIPQGESDKIQYNLFPDALMRKLVKKHGWTYEKEL